MAEIGKIGIFEIEELEYLSFNFGYWKVFIQIFDYKYGGKSDIPVGQDFLSSSYIILFYI